MSDIKNNANPELKIFLLGNKNDLIEERIVNTEEGNDIKKEFNLDLFKETSVKDEKKAENVFLEATNLLYNDNNKETSDKNKQKDCNIF
jgi:GTPase SAR1 family protein